MGVSIEGSLSHEIDDYFLADVGGSANNSDPIIPPKRRATI
jgi:hypothetical protein